MHAPPSDPESAKIIAAIRDAIPSEDFFPGGRTPLLTPEPFPLSRAQAAELERLSHRLLLFRQALFRIHRRSARGKLPPWIAAHLDAGTLEPAAVAPGLERAAVPGILCPELVLTENGWSLAALDPPARHLGLAAWLAETYALHGAQPIAGDPDGIPKALRAAGLGVPGGADDDDPPLAWLRGKVEALEGPAPAAPSWRMPSFDDRIPFALVHLRALRDVWRRELRDSQFTRLQQVVPYTWILDPSPLPPQAVIPRLELHSMRAVAALPREARAHLLLRSDDGVILAGRDASDDRWRDAVNGALDEAAARPCACVLQESAAPKSVAHPVWDPAAGSARALETRVRLQPFYVTQDGVSATLAAVLAILATEDGPAIFAPCAAG
jgi:hypothetical protein